MKFWLLSLFLVALGQLAEANVGVFTGYGHSIKLTSTDQIEMVREEVTIVPGRGPTLFTGDTFDLDLVEYDCRFELKNISEEPVKIQVGFPLNTQFLGHPYGNDRKVEDLVAEYRFIVQEGDKIHSLRYAPGDSEKELANLFLWDLEFQGGETKELRVSYVMPISMGWAHTTGDYDFEDYPGDWAESVETCLLEHFGYVTETGQSWAGTIGEAVFRIKMKRFEEYLLNRPSLEGISDEQRFEMMQAMPVWDPVVCRIMEPSGWEETDEGVWELRFENYEAAEDLFFGYYFLHFPQTHEDLRRAIRVYELDEQGRVDFADLMREYNGVKTENKRIQPFVAEQPWHGQAPFQKIPDEVIDAMEFDKEDEKTRDIDNSIAAGFVFKIAYDFGALGTWSDLENNSPENFTQAIDLLKQDLGQLSYSEHGEALRKCGDELVSFLLLHVIPAEDGEAVEEEARVEDPFSAGTRDPVKLAELISEKIAEMAKFSETPAWVYDPAARLSGEKDDPLEE